MLALAEVGSYLAGPPVAPLTIRQIRLPNTRGQHRHEELTLPCSARVKVPGFRLGKSHLSIHGLDEITDFEQSTVSTVNVNLPFCAPLAVDHLHQRCKGIRVSTGNGRRNDLFGTPAHILGQQNESEG